MTFHSVTDDPVIKRIETVGRILPHVRAKLVDPEGNVVPIGKPGELLTSGYVLQKGYWNDEEQTDRVMKRDAEGTLWMHTGDEGLMDEEGYLRSAYRFANTRCRGTLTDVGWQSWAGSRTSSSGEARCVLSSYMFIPRAR